MGLAKSTSMKTILSDQSLETSGTLRVWQCLQHATWSKNVPNYLLQSSIPGMESFPLSRFLIIVIIWIDSVFNYNISMVQLWQPRFKSSFLALFMHRHNQHSSKFNECDEVVYLCSIFYGRGTGVWLRSLRYHVLVTEWTVVSWKEKSV